MKYPRINKQPLREVNVPKLSGGLNFRDGLTGVKDNQLTDGVNMWYKDGMLRTRPPFVSRNAILNMTGRKEEEIQVETRFHNEVRLFYNGFDCVCATNKRIYIENSETKCDIEFEFQSSDKIFVMPKITGINGGDITFFCVEMRGTLYCYISNYTIWKLEYSQKTQLGAEALKWVKIDEEDIYAPTVYTHCQRTDEFGFKGTMFEGYNLLTPRFKIVYSAYNVADSNEGHPMRYSFGTEIATSGTIKATITYLDENNQPKSYTHIIDASGLANNEFVHENEPKEDGLTMYATRRYIGFGSEVYSDNMLTKCLNNDSDIRKYCPAEDNLVIEATGNLNNENREKTLNKVFLMTRSIWFGGAANGINGGSRLFLCGNKDENEKSLVVWSGLNNPLYFTENCYAYVGSKSCAVTAFGRQGENLIIFKENKIYCTYYAQNRNITADDLIEQTVVDYDANSVYFPLIQINGYVGCDCPDTVQMCRNRLVWASGEGKVYTLCNINQYNEHTVYELSDMIAPKLKDNKEKLKIATSADFDGHYVLFLGNCAYVMNYCSYGYQYVYSYSKTDDANTLIPWYFWDFSFLENKDLKDRYVSACVCALNGDMLMRTYFDASVDRKASFVGFTMKNNRFTGEDVVFVNDYLKDILQLKNSPINCNLTTKLFELGDGIYNMNIDNITLKIGANNGLDVFVRFISEQGEEVTVLKEKRECTTMKDVNFIRPKCIRPCVRSVLKFGLNIECDGQLAIDGMTVKFRMLGGAR